MFGIIGGTGFQNLLPFSIVDEVRVKTPYGDPSAPLLYGKLLGQDVVLMRRHGVGHEFAPHRVPYRANLWALKEAGVEGILACATVGGIEEAMGPGVLAVPDQLIDYTWGREDTYFEDFGKCGVHHIDFTHPFDENLRKRLLAAARSYPHINCLSKGTYACTQGPRLETAAEVQRYCRDGATMVGMTLYPEAALAREINMPYAAITGSVNHAAGVATSADGIAFTSLKEVIQDCANNMCMVVGRAVAGEIP